MPRYFFHLHNDEDIIDEEGIELPDLDRAREWADQQAVHMAAASVLEHHHLSGAHRIDVADLAGQVLISVLFRDVIGIKL